MQTYLGPVVGFGHDRVLTDTIKVISTHLWRTGLVYSKRVLYYLSPNFLQDETTEIQKDHHTNLNHNTPWLIASLVVFYFPSNNIRDT